MDGDFRISSDDDGPVIAHGAAPRFTARWTTGTDELAAIEGPCWTDEGAGGDEETICLYGFNWTDPPPGREWFEGLMRDAAAAIDAAIAGRL